MNKSAWVLGVVVFSFLGAVEARDGCEQFDQAINIEILDGSGEPGEGDGDAIFRELSLEDRCCLLRLLADRFPSRFKGCSTVLSTGAGCQSAIQHGADCQQRRRSRGNPTQN